MDTNLPIDESVAKTIEKFWEFFPPVWQTVKSQIRCEATENFEITVTQFHILRRVRHGIDSVSKLATDRHTSRPAISRAVDVLVNQGLITRTPNPDDRRNVRLSLTDDGQVLLDALFNNVRGWMAAQLATLTESELKSILQAGDALKKAFIK